MSVCLQTAVADHSCLHLTCSFTWTYGLVVVACCELVFVIAVIDVDVFMFTLLSSREAQMGLLTRSGLMLMLEF